MRLLSLDALAVFVLTIVLLVGGYQFYFWCQRRNWRKSVSLETAIDRWITYDPRWIWIYSGSYYPAIIGVSLTVQDPTHFVRLAFSYFVLLCGHMPFFLWFPTELPESWRHLSRGNGFSQRFLDLVQRYDARNNCFPSMHVGVSTLTGLHFATNLPFLAPYWWLFPVAVALSCLKTKQHFVADMIPGAIMGGGAFWIYTRMAG